MRRQLFTLAFPLFFTACGGLVQPDGTAGNALREPSDAGASGDDAGYAGGDAGTASDATAGPVCALGTRYDCTSVDDTLSRIEGRWLGCSGSLGFGGESVGIELQGNWAWNLVQRPDGTLVRQGGEANGMYVADDTFSMGLSSPYRFQTGFTSTTTGTPSHLYNIDSYDAPSTLRLTDATTGNVVWFARAPAYVPEPNDAGSDPAGFIEAGISGPPIVDGPTGCSIIGGTWDVASDYYGTNASFQFLGDGTFVGGPRSAALPAGAIYSGRWSQFASQLEIWNTIGLECRSGAFTSPDIALNSDCTKMTLTLDEDQCTGSRMFFDGPTVFTKR